MAYLSLQLAQLSEVRVNLIRGNKDAIMQEEAKGESSPDIATTFNVIGARQTLLTSYQDELLTAYSKNSAIEAEMKAKAQPAEE